MGETCYPWAMPLYVTAKPAGARCNLRCSYCYYLEKEHTLPQGVAVMSDQLLERFIRQYIAAQPRDEVLFIWHGGEPMLLPLEYYRKIADLQRRYAQGKEVTNVIQTNGTHITDAWCRFLRQEGWLVGVSLDGPQALHDACRRDAAGRGSYDDVLAGICRLNDHGVEWNAMTTVSRANVEHPEAIYDCVAALGSRFLQVSPVVERRKADGTLALPDEAGTLTAESITAKQWGEFLCRLFDRWYPRDVGRMYVDLFECTVANYAGVTPGICILAEHCGHAAALEANGDLYSCDHYAFAQHRLGNLAQQTLTEMMGSAQQQRFADQKAQGLPDGCRRCEYRFACHGECPKNRFATAPDGTAGLNYLCEGYRAFFVHADAAMRRLAAPHRPFDTDTL